MKFSNKGISDLKRVFNNAKEKGDLRGKSPEKAYMTDLLQLVIDSGIMVTAVAVKSNWVEVDTVGDLESRFTKNRLDAITYSL